jgi:hypothetical protein
MGIPGFRLLQSSTSIRAPETVAKMTIDCHRMAAEEGEGRSIRSHAADADLAAQIAQASDAVRRLGMGGQQRR